MIRPKWMSQGKFLTVGELKDCLEYAFDSDEVSVMREDGQKMVVVGIEHNRLDADSDFVLVMEN